MRYALVKSRGGDLSSSPLVCNNSTRPLMESLPRPPPVRADSKLCVASTARERLFFRDGWSTAPVSKDLPRHLFKFPRQKRRCTRWRRSIGGQSVVFRLQNGPTERFARWWIAGSSISKKKC